MAENILDRANKIVNLRSEEKDRLYGPFDKCMERASKILCNICPSKFGYLTAEGVYYALIALKLAREAFNHKEDNLLDAVAYIGALNNYLNDKDALYKQNIENFQNFSKKETNHI